MGTRRAEGLLHVGVYLADALKGIARPVNPANICRGDFPFHRDKRMITELETKLADLDAQRAQVEADIAAAHEANRTATVEAVRALITEAGYGLDDILPMLVPAEPAKVAGKRTRATGNDPREFPVYALIRDHSLTYARGRVPKWLSAEMKIRGMDPAMGADREAFRRDYMVRV